MKAFKCDGNAACILRLFFDGDDFFEKAGGVPLKDATNFIEAVSNLYTNVGPIWSVVIIFGIIVIPLSYRLYRDKQLQNAYRETINEKERQIQRLAKDNREWRNYFWRIRGLTEQEIADIESNADATPLTSPPSDIRSEN